MNIYDSNLIVIVGGPSHQMLHGFCSCISIIIWFVS